MRDGAAPPAGARRPSAPRGLRSGAGHRLAGYRVFLFGSRAGGTARPRSDFDIGVMGPAPLAPVVFQQIEDWLDEIDTLYRIDWVDMNRVTAAFRAEAMQHTEVLYAP